MKALKYVTGAAVAAAMTVTAAAPAEAQSRYRDRDRGGIDIGDVIAVGAAVAGVAAIASAVRGSNRNAYPRGTYGYPVGGYGYPAGYGYPNAGYGYGNVGYGGEQYAVDACAGAAQRYGRVSITDVDRRGSRSYRVRGVIDAGYNDGGYYNRGYDRYDARRGFSCTVRNDGRITDFDI